MSQGASDTLTSICASLTEQEQADLNADVAGFSSVLAGEGEPEFARVAERDTVHKYKIGMPGEHIGFIGQGVCVIFKEHFVAKNPTRLWYLAFHRMSAAAMAEFWSSGPFIDAPRPVEPLAPPATD